MKRRNPGPMYVLIVEDDESTAKMLCAYMQKIYNGDYTEPIICNSLALAITALNECEKIGKPFELCLLDLTLTDSQPAETISRWPFDRIATIVITGNDAARFSRLSIDAGACHFFQHPITVWDLAWAGPKAVRDFRHAKVIQRMEGWDRKIDEIGEKIPVPSAATGT